MPDGYARGLIDFFRKMSNNLRGKMNREAAEKHVRFLWTRYVMFGIGFWMLVTPATFNVQSSLVASNEIIMGLLVMLLSLCSLSHKRLWAPWTLCAIGVWLQIAPLVFWAPSGVSYLNDTGCGAMLILLALIIPGTPGGVEVAGGEVPQGWSYNPSSWNQRLPIIFLAFLAWMSARYMAAYQLGYIDTIWDPIFKEGTRSVVTSALSKSFPISDAGLGAFVYTMEVLMGFKGSSRRWYTMPWIVFLFGIMVVPAGFVSILLIMLQPLIVGSWCTWCLLTAVCMLIMIALTLDEMVAVCQYMATIKQKFWKIFWKGGTYEGPLDTRSPPLNVKWRKNVTAMLWGITCPWHLLISVLLGGLLMFAPSYLTVHRLLADNDHIIGAMVATLSFMSMAEVFRSVRFLNIGLAIWVIVFSLFFISDNHSHILFHLFWGVLVILASLPKGKIQESYGSWNRYVR
jgi:uncharacterized membrane protein